MSVVEVTLSLVFFYDNLSRLRYSVPPPPMSCWLRIPFVPQAAGFLRAGGTSLIVHPQNTGLSSAFHRRLWNEWGKEKSVWINMCLQEMEFELSPERWILIAMGRKKGMNRGRETRTRTVMSEPTERIREVRRMEKFCLRHGWGKMGFEVKQRKLIFYCYWCQVFFSFFFFLAARAYRILVPQPGIKPMTLAVEAQSLNHWTTREVPLLSIFKYFCFKV